MLEGLEVYVCARPPICCHVAIAGLRVGTNDQGLNEEGGMTHYWFPGEPETHPVEFLDYAVSSPNLKRFLRKATVFKGGLVSVPDIWEKEDYQRSMAIRDQLRRSGLEFVVPSHIEIPEKLPDDCRLGVPCGRFSHTIPENQLKEERVHLLGGSPRKQALLYLRLGSVVSVDGNMVHLCIQKFSKSMDRKRSWVFRPREYILSEMLEESLRNLKYYWKRTMAIRTLDTFLEDPVTTPVPISRSTLVGV